MSIHKKKVKDQRSTITKDGWVRLTEKNRRRAQDVFDEIGSGTRFPKGDWEQQIGIIFENRIREKPKNEEEPLQYPSAKHIRNLLKKSLEWMDDNFSGCKHPHVPPLPPPEKYKAFLHGELFSKKRVSRGK